MRQLIPFAIAAVAAAASACTRAEPVNPPPITAWRQAFVSRPVTLEHPPSASPQWRITSEGIWYNDLSGQFARPGDPAPIAPPLGTKMYSASFHEGPEGWLSMFPFHGAFEQPVPWRRSGHIRSRGPWWMDTNHDTRADLTRGVNLVAYLYSRDLMPNVHHREIDFRNARLEFRVKGDGFRPGESQLVFWVQGLLQGGKRFVNLALTAKPFTALALQGDWVRVVVDLKPDAGWTCLDAAPGRDDLYTCADPEDVLADVNRDFGFLLYPVPIDKSGARAPRGAISIDDVQLTYRLNERQSAGGS